MALDDTALRETTEAIRKSHDAGIHFPPEWIGKLSLDDGYRVQQGLLKVKLERGATQAGWKVGFTADAVREMFGAEAPVFGYLLTENAYDSGHQFTWSDLPAPGVESEVLVTLGADLTGPGVTREQALAAVATVAPAFEIVVKRGGDMGTDLSLGVADDVMQAAFVVGEAKPIPAGLELGDIAVDVVINGEVAHSVVGKEVMDHPLDSLAWLANTAANFGATLRAGQQVLTGSFTKPLPAAQGDSFESRFSHLGNVQITFA